MAKSLAIASLQILSVFLLASLGQSKTVFTNFTVYEHEYRGGDAQSIFAVAGLPNKTWGFDRFGTVSVVDNPLTQRISPRSTQVGRFQGFVAVASLDNKNIEAAITILFTDRFANGSTLELKGLFISSSNVWEVPIVGGTKQFRYATGYSVFEILSYVGDYILVKMNFYIRQNLPDDYPSVSLHK